MLLTKFLLARGEKLSTVLRDALERYVKRHAHEIEDDRFGITDPNPPARPGPVGIPGPIAINTEPPNPFDPHAHPGVRQPYGPDETLCRRCGRLALDHGEGRYSVYDACPTPVAPCTRNAFRGAHQ